MLALGPLAFASPWLLLALLGLPALWWLMRVTPPAPRHQTFPAIGLLLGLKPAEQTPARTPWWLLALRFLLAGLVILALSQPLLNPQPAARQDGAFLIVIDNGWSAARNWQQTRTAAERLLTQAERENRTVYLLTTADPERSDPGAEDPAFEPLDVATARERLAVIEPHPWPPRHEALASALRAFPRDIDVVPYWLSDGVQTDGADQSGVDSLGEVMNRLGDLAVYRPAEERLPHLLQPPRETGSHLQLTIQRLSEGFEESVTLLVQDGEGRILERLPVNFTPASLETTLTLELPLTLRNRVERLSLEGEAGANVVVLSDERWRRRPVGLPLAGDSERRQPLLSDSYYLTRALSPFTQVTEAPLEQLLETPQALIALPDRVLDESEARQLDAWIQQGGLLLRFAGPRLAESESRQLLPVDLRQGGRTLGGTLTWDQPIALDDFPEDSPLAGLQVPEEVTVSSQVLARPDLGLNDKTWARLEDGTPLITAEQRGEGWLVLVHTSAGPAWSNLPLSGLYVELLRRLVAFSAGVSGAGDGPLPAWQVLDGFGRLQDPAPEVRPLPQDTGTARIGPRQPPGYYGGEISRQALNLAPALSAAGTLPSLGDYGEERSYDSGPERPLMPWLLSAALGLALLDLLISLGMRGLLPSRVLLRKGTGLLAFALLGGLALSPDAQAQAEQKEQRALEASLETTLAYVQTGNPELDQRSRAGLTGLSQVLTRRTTIEPGPPKGVRPGEDELAFYPLLYWPVSSQQDPPDRAAERALQDYLDHGGTLLLDLGDGRGSRLDGDNRLRRLLSGIEIPRLVPVPGDHVLTRAFYLLQEFPGRYEGETLWVEETEETRHDGVATVIIGSHDWASAWAVDERGRPLSAVVPGGERQREMAFRFGVNLVMYALTGNYKSDQVHVPFILERLGQ
ncbi:DUF4159 domain-containing protein [Fodinicurvata fenggangensis]|uniref:DUF4159 domain-containing protein n=1 Tax=Fodinicurvata fenggangensis TaxID=1121830 RepID=UPI00047C1EB1|nr:DUF4159 domain-containing protein [Fodinicurvata fenggangensis]